MNDAKKKLSLTKKTLRNLGVRSGMKTGTVAYTNDCFNSNLDPLLTAVCDALSSKIGGATGRCPPPGPLTGFCTDTKGCGG